jgi:hypothetical protein
MPKQPKALNAAEKAAYDAGLERGRRFGGKQHIYGEDQIRLGWGLYRSGQADDQPAVKRAYYAGFRAAKDAELNTCDGDPGKASINVIRDDEDAQTAAVIADSQLRQHARQLPPPRENPPDSAVCAVRAVIDQWGAYWTVQSMLRALAEWARTAPLSAALDVAEHQRVTAIRKVIAS